MLYPDPELDDAGNYFQAHVPFEIPSSVAPKKRLRWLTSTNILALRSSILSSRANHCRPSPSKTISSASVVRTVAKCPWHPGPETWAQIQNALKEPVKVAKVSGLGTAQTSAEHRAATRASVLTETTRTLVNMLTASTSKNVLVAAVDLIHKAVTLSSNEEE